jgi:ribonuclease E
VVESPVAEVPVAIETPAPAAVVLVESAPLVATPAPVAEAAPVVLAATKPAPSNLPEIGRPEDVGLVQVATQVKAFEPVEIPVDAGPARRRRSEVKPADTAPVQGELVMVETSHTLSSSSAE